MKHVHAELMMEYAKDAMESETPWKRWEFRNRHCNDWSPLKGSAMWNPDTKYRRKPRVPVVAGIEFPDMILNQEDAVVGRSVSLICCPSNSYDFYISSVMPQDVNHVDYLRGWVHRTHDSASKYINLIAPKVE